MNWDHLRSFIAVAKAGSVIAAASTLGVSHATVLRNISKLETTLGSRLFDRLQTGYSITEQGREILAHALEMDEQAKLLMRRASAKNPAPEGLLQIVSPNNALFNLMPVLSKFQDEYPRITIRNEHRAPQAMLRSTADVALAITNTPPDDLVGRQLQRLEFAYFSARDYPLLKGAAQDPSICDWITWGETDDTDPELNSAAQERALRHFAKRPIVKVQTANYADALSATKARLGVSLLRKPQIELEELPFRSNLGQFGLWILTHQDLQRSGKVQAFMDFVVAYFEANSRSSLRSFRITLSGTKARRRNVCLDTHPAHVTPSIHRIVLRNKHWFC